MILIEHQGKELLKSYGLTIPTGGLVTTPEEAESLAASLGGKAALKIQVLAGRRGKAGGIRLVSTAAEAQEAASQMLGRELLGQKIDTLLVEERISAVQELYLSFTVDAASGSTLVLFSPQGGMDIEELAERHPQAIHRLHLASPEEDSPSEIAGWARGAGTGKASEALAQAIIASHQAFEKEDLLLLEVNPLFLKADGTLVVGDCKMEVDNNSLFRHEELLPLKEAQLSILEKEAAKIGVSYVEMEGSIALIASGAGLGMASLDMLQDAGLTPANFLDTGGGITRELMENAVRFVLRPERVKGGLINLYGGINPMVEAAQGIIAGLGPPEGAKPIVVKLVGNRQEEAWAILEAQGISVVKTVQTESAVEALARLLGRQR